MPTSQARQAIRRRECISADSRTHAHGNRTIAAAPIAGSPAYEEAKQQIPSSRNVRSGVRSEGTAIMRSGIPSPNIVTNAHYKQCSNAEAHLISAKFQFHRNNCNVKEMREDARSSFRSTHDTATRQTAWQYALASSPPTRRNAARGNGKQDRAARTQASSHDGRRLHRVTSTGNVTSHQPHHRYRYAAMPRDCRAVSA